MQNILKAVNPFVALLLFYFLMTVVLFGWSYNTMFIDDGISGLWEIEHSGKSWLDSYGFDSFYHGHYSFLILLNSIFGLNAMAWFLVFALMHALNATLIKLLFEKLYKFFDFGKMATRIAYAGSVFFLVSPYMTENVNWAATGHYAISLMCLLAISIWLIDYVHGNQKKALPMIALFFVSLFTHEISFLYPLFLGLLFILLQLKSKTFSWKAFLTQILAPQFLIIAIYLGLLKWARGTFIPHYGAQENFWDSFQNMPSVLAKYLVKLLGFFHFFPTSIKLSLYERLNNPWISILCILLISGIFFVLLRKKRKNILMFGFLGLAFLLLLLPALRLYFVDLFRFENARYSYFAFVFLAQLIALVIYTRKEKWHSLLFGTYTALSVFLLVYNVSQRTESGDLHNRYMKQLDEAVTPNSFLLNVPANLKGAYVFRATGRLPIAYEMNYKKKMAQNVQEVCSYVGVSLMDSFEAKRINDSTVHIHNKTPGSWFMKDGLGLSNFETDDYSLQTDEWGGYTMTFKSKKDTHLLLYSKGRFRPL